MYPVAQGIIRKNLFFFWKSYSALYYPASHCNTKASKPNDILRWHVLKALVITATHCTALQHTAPHCNTLQHTATHCSTLQHAATHCSALQHTATRCNTPQHTATHCNTLQLPVTHCIALQHTATHCNTLHGSSLFSIVLCDLNFNYIRNPDNRTFSNAELLRVCEQVGASAI
jgi:hypothetical protein